MGETRLYRINHLPKMNRAQITHPPLNHDRSLKRTPLNRLNMKRTGQPAFYRWTDLPAFVIHSPVVTNIGGSFVIDMVVR